ncbi:MAG: CDP-diacylglycerol--glycerol-3-phosphate 3-phosphatidyltransferase [Lachnospiraceae bacterium]|nr:CDP-diacylglycerol--glycerol-3-phosphate 3-phosphatidyltransferase [Lachnospiraceae bacterium]
MNLPNKLTILRTVLIIPFVIIMLTGCCGILSDWIALFIFILASVTDLLDGKIARKYNLVTNFGKFMDPLADKLLVCSALICLLNMGRIPAWAVLIIMGREFIISGFRLVASDNGVVIAASMWGKSKTVSQMIMIGILIADIDFILFKILGIIALYVSVALTIISLIDYIMKNKEVMREDNKI